MSGPKLRTARMEKPARDVTVYLVEQIGSDWHPVVERHQGCHGMTHETCTVLDRGVWLFVAAAGALTRGDR